MPDLSRSNSDVATNSWAVKGAGCVFPGPASSRICRSAMAPISYLPSQLLVSQAATDYMPHSAHEAFRVVHVTVVGAKRYDSIGSAPAHEPRAGPGASGRGTFDWGV
jgi:hypothetical protein